MKIVRWCEPISETDNDPCYPEMTVEDAIAQQRLVAWVNHGWKYATDQLALEDFLTVYWAEVIEVDPIEWCQRQNKTD